MVCLSFHSQKADGMPRASWLATLATPANPGLPEVEREQGASQHQPQASTVGIWIMWGYTDVSISQERNLECPRHMGRNAGMPVAFFNFWRVSRVNGVLVAHTFLWRQITSLCFILPWPCWAVKQASLPNCKLRSWSNKNEPCRANYNQVLCCRGPLLSHSSSSGINQERQLDQPLPLRIHPPHRQLCMKHA